MTTTPAEEWLTCPDEPGMWVCRDSRGKESHVKVFRWGQGPPVMPIYLVGAQFGADDHENTCNPYHHLPMYMWQHCLWKRMKPQDMTKLKKIKAALKASLALRERTTGGQWLRTDPASSRITSADSSAPPDGLVAVCAPYNDRVNDNVEFITYAHTFAPLMAQSLLLSIGALEKECAKFNFPEEDRPELHEALQRIEALWPDEPEEVK